MNTQQLPADLTILSSFLEQCRSRIDSELDRFLSFKADGTTTTEDPGRLREGMRYAVLNGGKRMRPVVVVAACEAAGGHIQQALGACCAIEMVHAYSLVHDDLPSMDNDLERRGKPTVHVKYGEAQAILIGDALLTEAFAALANSHESVPRSAIATAVAKLAFHAGVNGMVGGQVQDIYLGQSISDLKALDAVHALKTGGLYAAAGAMGAGCGGASNNTILKLERFGLAFGIAFQHADDMLDDDQQSLRPQALRRVDELSQECCALAESFGQNGLHLLQLARWVRDRAHRAASGDRRD